MMHIPGRVRGGAALLAAALLWGCEGSGRPPEARSTPAPLISPTPTPAQERPSTKRTGPTISNEAMGRSRGRVKTAMADLKAVSLWGPLTRRLYSLQLQSDPGLDGLPDDGHLADAMLSAVVDREGAGTHCSVRFYPAAMKREMTTLERGYLDGSFGPPPTLRQLWAAILAHELAHCRNWEAGEPFAEEWEERALAALRRAGLE